MKKLHYERLFKATLATTVAAGAIVVSAPVHTEAAAKSFSDVKDIPSHHFYDAVMDLSSRGIIGGYPDGTFKPSQQISRQHAAKFLALSLGLDTVNVKDPGFKDVNKKNPYYSAIAALVEAGIISGYADNTFKPNDNLTRTQMAKMLVLGFKFKSKDPQRNPFSDINASKWDKSFIQVLYANDITTGTSPTTFSPNAFVTRGQLASFIYRSEAAAESKPTPEPQPEPEVIDRNQLAVDRAYFQVTGGTLEISYGNNATDAQKLAAVQEYATSLITEQGVVAKAAEGKRAGLYVVTLTKGGAKTDKTIAIEFESKAGTHFIKEVKALNAKQVEVTFATPISKSTVLDNRNVVQNISVTTNGGATPGQLTGALSSDGKTLTITASGTFNGDYTFTATDAIKSTTNEPLDMYSETLKAYDTTAPRLVSSSASAKTSTTSFSLFFNEPVNASGATAYVNNTLATVTNNSADPNRLDVTVRTPVRAGTTAKISVTNVKDYNNNLASPNPVETSVTVTVDTNAPTVTDVKVTANNRIELTYDKEMDITSFAGKARIVHPNGTTTQLTATSGSNSRTVILSGASSIYNNMYNAILFVDAGVKDIYGYDADLYSSNLNFNYDTTAPALSTVEWRDGQIIANFTEEIALGTNNVVYIVDQQTGSSTPIYLNYYGGSNASIYYNTITINHALPNGVYQLQIPADTVVDKAPIPNPNVWATDTFTVQNFEWDTTPPEVYGFTNSGIVGSTQIISYTVTDENSGVDLTSLENIHNYTWDGYALPEGSSVTASVMSWMNNQATSVAVSIHVPTASITANQYVTITVSNIRDNAGNWIVNPVSGNVTLSGYQN